MSPAIQFGVTPVEPDVLLRLIEMQVQKVSPLKERAFLSLWDDKVLVANPKATQFAAIRPNGFPLWQSIVTGSGFDVTGYNASLTLSVFIQHSSDIENQSIRAISDNVLGMVRVVSATMASLQGFIPRDANQNALVREYMRVSDGGWRMTNIDGKGGSWHRTSADFECKFTAKLPGIN